MDTTDSTFSAAKLREFVENNLETDNSDLYGHTAVVEPDSKASEMLSFMESIYRGPDDLPHDLQNTRAAATLRKSAATRHVGKSVEDLPAYSVGVTEKNVEISPARAFSKMQNSIVNGGAPYTAVFFGGMDTGKTSTSLLYAEIWRDLVPQKYGRSDPVIISNADSIGIADHTVQTACQLARLMFGSRDWMKDDLDPGGEPVIDTDRPKLFIFDECSTHLDARRNNYEVSEYYSPMVKRFAKVNTDAIHIGHSGMDIHKELRRSVITTEFIIKREPKIAEVYEDMDEDQGGTLKYELTGIPHTSVNYHPDDDAPWQWPNH